MFSELEEAKPNVICVISHFVMYSHLFQILKITAAVSNKGMKVIRGLTIHNPNIHMYMPNIHTDVYAN